MIWREKMHAGVKAAGQLIGVLLLAGLTGFGAAMLLGFLPGIVFRSYPEWIFPVLFWSFGGGLLIFGLYEWWKQQCMVFSATTRGAVFASKEDRDLYGNMPGIESGWSMGPRRTANVRPGTTRAKLKLTGLWIKSVSGLLVRFGLMRLPLIGPLLHGRDPRFYSRMGRALDAAQEEVLRLEAPTMDELRSADPRPPVILLRSFADDVLRMAAIEGRPNHTDATTFEEVVASGVAGWGPLIAIGDPREKLPPLGAARGYFTHEHWQFHAIEFLRHARVVVVVMGLTRNISWEIDRIFEQGHAPKTLILFPPLLSTEVKVRFHRLEEVLGRHRKPEWKMPEKHLPRAVVFARDSRAILISSSTDSTLTYQDVIALGAKVLRANRVGS